MPSQTVILIIPIVLVTAVVVLVQLRRPGFFLTTRPVGMVVVRISIPLSEALDRIQRAAIASGYRVVLRSESNSTLVLCDRPSFVSFGFFFPLYGSQQADGTSLIEVGIRSRFLQNNPENPIRLAAYDRCYKTILRALEKCERGNAVLPPPPRESAQRGQRIAVTTTAWLCAGTVVQWYLVATPLSAAPVWDYAAIAINLAASAALLVLAVASKDNEVGRLCLIVLLAGAADLAGFLSGGHFGLVSIRLCIALLYSGLSVTLIVYLRRVRPTTQN